VHSKVVHGRLERATGVVLVGLVAALAVEHR
jgi:hypothetical protein